MRARAGPGDDYMAAMDLPPSGSESGSGDEAPVSHNPNRPDRCCWAPARSRTTCCVGWACCVPRRSCVAPALADTSQPPRRGRGTAERALAASRSELAPAGLVNAPAPRLHRRRPAAPAMCKGRGARVTRRARRRRTEPPSSSGSGSSEEDGGEDGGSKDCGSEEAGPAPHPQPPGPAHQGSSGAARGRADDADGAPAEPDALAAGRGGAACAAGGGPAAGSSPGEDAAARGAGPGACPASGAAAGEGRMDEARNGAGFRQGGRARPCASGVERASQRLARVDLGAPSSGGAG